MLRVLINVIESFQVDEIELLVYDTGIIEIFTYILDFNSFDL